MFKKGRGNGAGWVHFSGLKESKESSQAQAAGGGGNSTQRTDACFSSQKKTWWSDHRVFGRFYKMLGEPRYTNKKRNTSERASLDRKC